MNISSITRSIQQTAAKNAPTILTSIGVVGAISTAILAGKATWKTAKHAAAVHHQLVDDQFEPLSAKEQAKILIPVVWKWYIPTALSGIATVTCILSANRISTSRAAVLASAYSLSQETLTSYSKKVAEKFGEDAEREVRREVALERQNPRPTTEVVFLDGDVLCKDLYSGRTFTANPYDIREAVIAINWQITNGSCTYASLSDFYEKIGLEPTEESPYVGWSLDELLEVKFVPELTSGYKPVLGIRFNPTPERAFDSYR